MNHAEFIIIFRKKLETLPLFCTVKEAAYTLDIPVSNIYTYIYDGTIFAVKKGKNYMIFTESLLNIFKY